MCSSDLDAAREASAEARKNHSSLSEAWDKSSVASHATIIANQKGTKDLHKAAAEHHENAAHAHYELGHSMVSTHHSEQARIHRGKQDTAKASDKSAFASIGTASIAVLGTLSDRRKKCELILANAMPKPPKEEPPKNGMEVLAKYARIRDAKAKEKNLPLSVATGAPR